MNSKYNFDKLQVPIIRAIYPQLIARDLVTISNPSKLSQYLDKCKQMNKKPNNKKIVVLSLEDEIDEG